MKAIQTTFSASRRRVAVLLLLCAIAVLLLAGCGSSDDTQDIVRTVIVTVLVDMDEIPSTVEVFEVVTTTPQGRAGSGSTQTQDGIDIFDLLDQDSIEVKTRGSSIDEVEIEIRRKGDEEINVRIPAGTYFVAGNRSTQNMISRRAVNIKLSDDGWKSARVPAACANMQRGVPGSGDTFTLQPSPFQIELEVVIEALAEAALESLIDYAVEQAAIWIITDNADYDDLGTLVSSFTGFGGTRMINAYEAAKAMSIIDQAGIDITTKAIWRDRRTILQNLKDAELSEWLEGRARQTVAQATRTEIPAVTPTAGTAILTGEGVLASGSTYFDLAYSPDGETLAVSSCVFDGERCGGGLVRLYDTNNKREVGTLEGHTSSPYSLAWSPEGGQLVSSTCALREDSSRNCIHGEIFLWDAKRQQPMGSLEGALDWVLDVDYSASGELVAAPVCTEQGEVFFECERSEVYTWDASGREEPQSIYSGVERLVIETSPVEDVIGVADGGAVKILQMSDGSLEVASETLLIDVFGFSWSPDGMYLAAYGDAIVIIDREVGRRAAVIEDFYGTDSSITAIDWTPDGAVLVVALCNQYGDDAYCTQGELRFYDMLPLEYGYRGAPNALELLYSLPGVDVWSMDISPDGRSIATTSDRADVVRILEMPSFEGR